MKGRGLGSVREIRPNYWEARLYLGKDPDTGKETRLSAGVAGTKRDAERRLAQLVAEAEKGVDKGAARDVGQLLEDYINFGEAKRWSPLTTAGYRSIARQIANDPISRKLIRKLGVRDADAFYVRLLTERQLESATVNRYHALLRAAYNQAVKWEWVRDNPILRASPPEEYHEFRGFVPDELVLAIVLAAEQSRNPENAVVFRLAAAIGDRRGEFCALRWTNIDFDLGLVHIRRSIAQLPEQPLIEKDTKTHQDRKVELDTASIAILRAHRDHQTQIAHDAGSELAPNAFVFANMVERRGGRADGTVPSRPSRFTQAFRRIRRKVPGAEDVRLQDLRRWSANALIEAGESLPAVAQRMGHRVETLVRHYVQQGQVSPEARDAVGNRLRQTNVTRIQQARPGQESNLRPTA